MSDSPTTSGKQDASSDKTKLWNRNQSCLNRGILSCLKEHWIVAWFVAGLASYALIAVISYWLMMHGFTIADHSSYDRATTVATIIQATLAAAGLLAVSAALLAIARNTDKTYGNQLDQQKWQRKEEFVQFAESEIQKGLEPIMEFVQVLLRQIRINSDCIQLLAGSNGSKQYFQVINLAKFNAQADECITKIACSLNVRALAEAPFWLPMSKDKDKDKDKDSLDQRTECSHAGGKDHDKNPVNLRRYKEPSAIPLIALTTAQAFCNHGINISEAVKKIVAEPSPNDYLKNPFTCFLVCSEYYSRYYTTDTSHFPAILALVDLIPSLLSIVEYLEGYNVGQSLLKSKNDGPDEHKDTCEKQIIRFIDYLSIPSLQPLFRIHDIYDEIGLKKYLVRTLHNRSHYCKKTPDGTQVTLTESRKRELKFWFGPYDDLLVRFYTDVYSANRKMAPIDLDWWNAVEVNRENVRSLIDCIMQKYRPTKSQFDAILSSVDSPKLALAVKYFSEDQKIEWELIKCRLHADWYVVEQWNEYRLKIKKMCGEDLCFSIAEPIKPTHESGTTKGEECAEKARDAQRPTFATFINSKCHQKLPESELENRLRDCERYFFERERLLNDWERFKATVQKYTEAVLSLLIDAAEQSRAVPLNSAAGPAQSGVLRKALMQFKQSPDYVTLLAAFKMAFGSEYEAQKRQWEMFEDKVLNNTEHAVQLWEWYATVVEQMIGMRLSVVQAEHPDEVLSQPESRSGAEDRIDAASTTLQTNLEAFRTSADYQRFLAALKVKFGGEYEAQKSKLEMIESDVQNNTAHAGEQWQRYIAIVKAMIGKEL